MKLLKKQILIILVFSILASITMIVHGVFFGLDWSQIKRLSIEGIIITFLIVFPGILFLEWIFDVNNDARFKKLEDKINKLKRNKK
ncbi:MAG: hypothetical protein WC438_03795 [Candidatus Pacearchaeota archaeon]